MAHRKHHRRYSSRKKRGSKNIIKKTFDSSVSIAKSTSKKYMPRVKTGVESVGSKVVQTGEQSIPYLQQITRKFFGMISPKSKTRKHYKH